MLPYGDSLITRIALAAFFLLVIVYGYFELRGYLFGPRIDVPATMIQVTSEMVTISGTATHIATLAMNGEDIPVTEQGAFSEPYLLAPGYNRIVLDAEDKYGHTNQKVIEVVYTPPAPAADTSASSSVATSTESSSTDPVAH